MTRRSKIEQVSAGVGTPQPKYTPVKHGGPVVAFEIHDSEQVDLSIEALDSEGNPAGASFSWTTSDDTIVALTGDVTSESVTAVASPGDGGLGDATVTCTVTDTSDGDTHDATFDITVVAGDAVTFNITAGTPTPKA